MISTFDNQVVANEYAALRFQRSLYGGISRSFRGEIWDYIRKFELGTGYIGDWELTNLCQVCRARGGIEKCRHFEIGTARHLIGPLRAIRDPHVRVMMLLKAAQTGGSLAWDLSVHYLLVHSPYKRIKVFMDCDEKATKYCQQRFMDTLKANPDISPLLPTGADRFGVTFTELRLLNGKTLFVGGLNNSNASSLPADVLILDEGWLHQSDGLMKKAFDRLKQTKRGKIIVVGQAGKVDEDQDKIWKSLNVRVPLTWACPCCGGRQQFSLTDARPADFIPLAPLPDGVRNVGQLILPAQSPKPETYYGMKVPGRFSELDTPEKILQAATKATIECYHCGFEIPDTREMRQALNDTFDQEYRVQRPDGSFYTPPNYGVGFWQPDPASMFVSYKETMYSYIVAKQTQKRLGNKELLITFYQANWATAWSDDLVGQMSAPLPMNIFDDLKAVPGEKLRTAAVDIQDKLTNVWVEIWAVGEGSAIRLLWWEHIESPMGLTLHERRAFCKDACRKLFTKFSIQPQNVKIDIGHEPELIFEWAAEDRLVGKYLKGADGKVVKQDVYYGLVRGDDAPGFKHRVRGNKIAWAGFSMPFYEQTVLKRNNVNETLLVPYRLMSTNRTNQVAQRFIEQQDAPTMEIPPRYLADTSLLGLWNQLNSEMMVIEKGKKKWKQIHQRPNHGRDCFRMHLMRMEECGLLVFAGRVEQPEPEAVETK